jgi:Xaa-Pro aminopeptidase
MSGGDPSAFARTQPGTMLSDALAQLDMARLRRYRLGRLREQLKEQDLGACVLADGINVRYATGSRNMQIWTIRNPARYVFVPAEGPVVLFDFGGCEHLSRGLETVDEVRPATTWFFFTSGPRVEERAKQWAAEIADLVAAHGGGNRRLGVDRVNPAGVTALAAHGLQVVDANPAVEHARAIKSPDEIACLYAAISVCEAGFARVRDALEPGLTENELWSILHQTNIAMGGEYIETRLLSSGPRTNPWFQESSDRVIRAGDLVAIDSDMYGRFGYFADVSRTFFCGPGRPSGEQRELYGLAHEQIHHNMELLRPGVSFRELSEKSWKMPDAYLANRYMTLVHGAGLSGEYPYITYPQDFSTKGYDGLVEASMTLCVESYIGAAGGAEGVKLEQLVLVTGRGAVPLSTFPFEDALLG